MLVIHKKEALFPFLNPFFFLFFLIAMLFVHVGTNDSRKMAAINNHYSSGFTCFITLPGAAIHSTDYIADNK